VDKTKRKNNPDSLRRYWYVFFPLMIVLALMVKFPLRIDLRESFYDALFYGIVCLACVVFAIRVYQRFGKRAYRLIAMILLCSILSGWQIFDLYVLRTGLVVLDWGPNSAMIGGLEDHEGGATYNVRFRNKNIMCHVLDERYWGHYLLAITIDIKRDSTFGACGG
jgi:hypothetical protein